LGPQHENAFLRMIADFEKNDPATYQSAFARKKPWSSAEYKEFLKECARHRLDWRPGPSKVSLTRYVVSGEGTAAALAFGLLRFPLDHRTEKNGGNLFCAVPPGLRGHGYGSYCLSRLLFEAVRAGLRRALVTCSADNPAARRVIEKNRGEFLDTIKVGNEDISRFWIDFR
jgi:predicted acetyltransferase